MMRRVAAVALFSCAAFAQPPRAYLVTTLQASFDTPFGIARDRTGNLYVAETGTRVIGKITPDGVVHAFAASPATDLAVDESGNVYASEFENNRVVKITPDGVLSVFAGAKDRFGVSGDGGPAVDAGFSGPRGLAFDSAGSLYIATLFDNRVRVVTRDGIIRTFIGKGGRGPSGDGGPATQAEIDRPTAVAVDSVGNVFVCAYQNGQIRKVTPDGIIHTVTTGVANAMTVAPDRSVIFTEGQRNIIRRIRPDGSVETVAGDGAAGFAGDGGPAIRARFNIPFGITADAAGTLWVADAYNNRIRKLEPAQIFPRAVVNAATYLPGPIAAGEIVTLFGYDLGDSSVTRVLFNGSPADLLYVSATAINALVPRLSDSATSVRIQVEVARQKTNEIVVPVAAAAPGIFSLDESGAGPAVAFNEDGSLNAMNRRARPGTSVTIYATGVSAGVPLRAAIGGETATITSIKPAAGLPPGVEEVRLIVPATAHSGAQPLTISTTAGDVPAAVIIAIE